MRLQVSNPSDHRELFELPWSLPLATWPVELIDPGGMHRHIVRFLEVGAVTYVLKELPEHLAEREYRLGRALGEARMPAAEPIGVVTDRGPSVVGEAMVITRHIDFALPYRVLLSGRGLKIPYLGERLLDALVGLLARLHLAGFYWGDCSLSNTLFRRDAGALTAFVIDLETGELHGDLSDGQRLTDLMIAVENVAGGLLDLEAAGRLAQGIDPMATALQIERRYHELWAVLTAEEVFQPDERYRIDQRLRRLHELGFDVGEVEYSQTPGGDKVRLVPRVVELGYFAPKLASLTGLQTGENQARRLLDEVHQFGAALERNTGKRVPENVAAARWLDQVYEPAMASIPADLADKLEPAELYHQILEHRWFLSEHAGKDVGLAAAIASYVDDVLHDAPRELIVFDPPTAELTVITSETVPPD